MAVVNKGFDRAKCRHRSIEGRASFQGPSDVASLSVSFFWPLAGGYHVIALDHEHYRWAMVAGPTRGYLWILAREPQLDQAALGMLIRQATDLRFGLLSVWWTRRYGLTTMNDRTWASAA